GRRRRLERRHLPHDVPRRRERHGKEQQEQRPQGVGFHRFLPPARADTGVATGWTRRNPSGIRRAESPSERVISSTISVAEAAFPKSAVSRTSASAGSSKVIR